MKALQIMPNFTVVAKKSHPDYYSLNKDGIVGRLLAHCEVTSEGNQVDIFRITPDSLWYGMNIDEGVDFINFLKENSDGIPDAVLIDLKKYTSRFGFVTLVGDDCIRIKDSNILKEVLNNTSIMKSVYEQDGDTIFFSNISFVELQGLFSREIGYPIKVHSPRVKTFYIKLDEETCFTVKASNTVEAFTTLYGNHEGLDEKALREKLKLKRDITAKDVALFMETIYNERDLLVTSVSNHTTYTPMRFIF